MGFEQEQEAYRQVKRQQLALQAAALEYAVGDTDQAALGAAANRYAMAVAALRHLVALRRVR